MPLEKITERIIKDARDEAKETLKEARSKKEAILKQADQGANHAATRILEEAKREAEDERNRILSAARLEARNLVLREKQKGVENVFHLAIETLLSLPDHEYFDVIEAMLLKEVVSGDEEIIVSPRDKERLTPDLLTTVNKALDREKRRGQLRFSDETREIKGGFILKSAAVEINNSFSARLKALKEKLEPRVLEMLLKDEP